MAFDNIKQIVLPDVHWQTIVEHCRRKIVGARLPGESEGKKAYGILAGRRDGGGFVVERVVCFKKNVRDVEPYKSHMDKMMQEHAVPSTTPLSGRGWMTDPQELKECYDRCDQDGLVVLGTYHMHIVPWQHDGRRDTPTQLDTILATDSGLFSFIVSMVDVDNPSMRSFYEGDIDREVPVHILQEKMVKAG